MTASTPSIVLVDDEPELRNMLQLYFAQQGLTLTGVAGAEGFRAIMASQTMDLVLLDLNLGGEDGLMLARELRERQPNAGLIMLTVRSEEIDRVMGLELGADDYVGKPFSPRELLARVKSVLRRVVHRSKSGPAVGEVVRFAGWRLALRMRRLVAADGHEVPLTPAEFDLLKVFIDHRGRVMSREDLVASIQGTQADRTIDVLVKRLRAKIEPNPRIPQLIKTARSEGYVFEAAVG